MSNVISALQSSVTGLRATVEGLSAGALRGPAYPTEWTIADTLSHLGSGAVITERSLRAAQAGEAVPDGFANGVWDDWNAKTPEEQAADLLVADGALLDAVDTTSQAQRASLRLPFGPTVVNFDEFLGHRLNEHALHRWDVEVALDPGAVVAPESVEVVIDQLGTVVGYAGRPISDERSVFVRTVDPDRRFRLELGPDAVVLDVDHSKAPDLTLTSEAFIRLVYGRLDPDHTPASTSDGDHLDELRRIFPGI